MYSMLHKGLNLWGWTASVNMEPGEALAVRDVLYRLDGSVMKHWGWERVTPLAAATRPLALRSFNYKGKNNDEAANPARPGNLGIADGGATINTRRAAFYSGALELTETQCRRWEPADQTYQVVALPAGVTVDLRGKPDMVVIQNNIYIVGWATANLRYDPVDEALYEWGWDNLPTLAGGQITVDSSGGNDLIPSKTYKYRASWVDLYTGEESGLGPVIERTTTDANMTVDFAAGAFPVYAGTRHFIDAGNLTNPDVGLVLYRTGPNGEAFYFLDLVVPGLAAATVKDDGLEVDYSLKAEVATYDDMPTLDGMCQFRSMIFGYRGSGPPPVPDGQKGYQAQLQGNSARIYYNDFRGEKSFIERWDVRNYKELPLDDGEILTGVEKARDIVVVGTNKNCYVLDALPDYETGVINIQVNPMDWSVGVVGPKAIYYNDGWLYFLSDRGPYRWAHGMPQPQYIGKNLLPMFFDPESGLCQLTDKVKRESEIYYDQDADVVRWIFPTGPTTVLNRHLTYPIRGTEFGLKYWQGWGLCSPRAQCFDYGNAYHGLVGGLPASGEDTSPAFAFGDDDGFVNQYNPDSTRGGLVIGGRVSATALGASTVGTLVALDGVDGDVLPTAGDGLLGIRLEVVHVDGTIDVRRIASNTTVNIVPTFPFSQEPDGGTWYIGGIPFYWRSWVDSMGDPSRIKDLIHLHIGYNREILVATAAIDAATGDLAPVDPGSLGIVDITVSASSEWPLELSEERVAVLDRYRSKVMIAKTGRYFTYEVANSRPDSRFMLTWLKPETKMMGERL